MKIIIVNELDEIIGTKERSEVDYTKDIYRISCLWLNNSKGEVLLAKRSMNKDKDPGKWGPAVAGTNDAGETYESNIYKEAQEEIGLTGVEFTRYNQPAYKDYPRKHFEQWFTVTLDRDASSFTLQEEEVDEATWFTLERVKQELAENPDKFIPALPQIIKDLGL